MTMPLVGVPASIASSLPFIRIIYTSRLESILVVMCGSDARMNRDDSIVGKSLGSSGARGHS